MFRFSIRELMLVTLVVAMAVAAGLTQLDRRRIAKENGQLRKELKKLKDYVGEVPFTDTGAVPAPTSAPGGPWGPPKSAPNSLAPATTRPGEPGLPPRSFGP